VDIPAGEAREVAWNVTAPAQLAFTRAEALLWEIEARDTVSGARDALKAAPAHRAGRAADGAAGHAGAAGWPFTLDAAPPADALPGTTPRGGLKLALQPKLAEGMPGVRDWFINYPFACLEQKTSKAVGLRDGKLWQTVVSQLPGYLDSDGLATTSPRARATPTGAATCSPPTCWPPAHEAPSINPAFALPDDARAPWSAA
jgi:hypothetical protein